MRNIIRNRLTQPIAYLLGKAVFKFSYALALGFAIWAYFGAYILSFFKGQDKAEEYIKIFREGMNSDKNREK